MRQYIYIVIFVVLGGLATSCGTSKFSSTSQQYEEFMKKETTTEAKADTAVVEAKTSKAAAFHKAAPAFSGNYSEKVINPVEAKLQLAENSTRKERVVSGVVDQEVSTIAKFNQDGKVLETKTSIISHETNGFYVYAGGGVSMTKTTNPLGRIGGGYDWNRFSTGLNLGVSEGTLGELFTYKGYNVDTEVMFKLLKASSLFQFSIGAEAGFLKNTNLQSAKFKVTQEGETLIDEDIWSEFKGYNLKVGPKATFEMKASNRVSSKLYDLRIFGSVQYDIFNMKSGYTDTPINKSANATSVVIGLKWNFRKIF